MKWIRYSLLALFGLFSLSAEMPTEPAPGYFRAPLDIPIALSGTFGELRSNHFHTGLDIKTNNQTGYRVYASAAGYISRIKISAWGYGKAVYVTHPNGFTTVYAHLDRLAPDIQNWVTEQQYKRKNYEVDLYPTSNQFTLGRGQVIAFSGNTGGSQAPHLHFEIRKGDYPVNPWRYDFNILDTRKPIIRGISLIPESLLYDTKTHAVQGSNGNYTVEGGEIHTALKNFGIGFLAYDQQNAAENKNGYYSAKLYVNELLVYQSNLDELDFSKNRYINAHIDFTMRAQKRQNWQRCSILPGNALDIYQKNLDGLIYAFDEKKEAKVKLLVTDLAGNESEVNFTLVYQNKELKERGFQKMLIYNKYSKMLFQEAYFEFNPGSFYQDVPFTYTVDETDNPKYFSSIHQVNTSEIPVHKYYDLYIKPKELPAKLVSKALIVEVNEKDAVSSLGGSFKDPYISTRVRAFGKYAVMVDTIPPKLVNLNIPVSGSMTGRLSFKMKVTDNLSGIEKYNAWIDGQWVLMEYEPKLARLTHYFQASLPPGKHELKVEVRDDRDNVTTFTKTITK